MLERAGDLWACHANGAWVTITTNGIVRQDGAAVMGRGVAYAAAQRYPWLARSLGLEYVNIPVSSGSLSDATLDRILEVLRNAGDRRVFFHCGSGNRVGGALIPYLMLDKGLDEEAAVEAAMRVGLRSPELMQWGLDYTQRHAP